MVFEVTGTGQPEDMDLAAHFGLLPFSLQEAREAGITARQLLNLVRAKEVIKVRRDVYLCGYAEDDLLKYQQQVAAELKGKTNYCAIGLAAMALLGLPNPYQGRWTAHEVQIAGPRSLHKDNVFANPGWDLVETPWGWCTDAMQTAAWAAQELPLPQALIITDVVARQIAHSKDRFYLASEQCRTSVRRRLVEVVDLPAMRLANPAAESPAESFYRGHVITKGLPEPLVGVPMLGASGAQYFVDMLLGDLIIEVDGKLKYTHINVLTDEKRREDDLRLTGRDFIRSFVEDLYQDADQQMVALIRKLSTGLSPPMDNYTGVITSTW